MKEQLDDWTDIDFVRGNLQHSSSLKHAANRVLFSRAYSLMYVLMILLNVTLILWIIISASIKQRIVSPTHWLFITLEIVINAALFFEISIRLLSLGKDYFRSRSNVFDLAVLALSFIGLIVFFVSTGAVKEADDIATTLLLIFRYAIQLLRLVLLIKNQQRALKTHTSKVDFSTIDIDNEPLLDEDEIQLQK